jgi:hypothetical protein
MVAPPQAPDRAYASGVDLLLWETEKRLIPDLDAISR